MGSLRFFSSIGHLRLLSNQPIIHPWPSPVFYLPQVGPPTRFYNFAIFLTNSFDASSHTGSCSSDQYATPERVTCDTKRSRTASSNRRTVEPAPYGYPREVLSIKGPHIWIKYLPVRNAVFLAVFSTIETFLCKILSFSLAQQSLSFITTEYASC